MPKKTQKKRSILKRSILKRSILKRSILNRSHIKRGGLLTRFRKRKPLPHPYIPPNTKDTKMFREASVEKTPHQIRPSPLETYNRKTKKLSILEQALMYGG